MTETSQQIQPLPLQSPSSFTQSHISLHSQAAVSIIMVLHVLVLVLSIGLGAVSYSVFIRLMQKEEIEEIKELIGDWRGL